jgi:suppressor of tumorigenicity protein 13
LENGDRIGALNFLNSAVSIGGATAMLLTKRADILLKLKRPNAAIADCDAAHRLNTDSAKAYRVRGLAYRGLQLWEKAHADLANAQKIDFDDSVENVKKFVDEKWKIVAEAKKEYKIKMDDFKKSTKTSSSSGRAGSTGGFPGADAARGFPGAGPTGGFPGAGGIPANLMGDLMNDPELMSAFMNPKVMTAMQAMMTNPAAIFQYQNDPEVGPVLMKLMSKMGNMGGFPGAVTR